MSGLPYMTMDELTLIFGYANNRETRRAIRRGTLAVPTYKLRGRIVADSEVVKSFFAKKREEGLRKLDGVD